MFSACAFSQWCAVFQQYPATVQQIAREIGPLPAKNLATVYPKAASEMLRIAIPMLNLDPDQRPTVEQVLADPLFSDLWTDGGRDTTLKAPAFALENGFAELDETLTIAQLRNMIYEEVSVNYHT
eukprot:scaffold13134_cov39-Prasinocladus_malaysianus.AAC.1